MEETAISFETSPPHETEMRSRIEGTASLYPWLVCELDGALAGYAYAGPFNKRAAYRWTVELSMYVSEECRGKGVGRALLSALIDRLGRQGFVNAIAQIALPNESSVRLFESFGFERVGTHRRVGYKLGRWIDVGQWELALREPRDDPAEPIAFERLEG